MSTRPVSPNVEQRPTWLTLGSGWLWPVAFGAAIVALFFVPGHNPAASGGDDLVATVAVLYVVGLIVIGVRLIRGVILRAGGSRDPIVLLGRGPDPLLAAAIRPRWRLAAIAAGLAATLTGVFISNRLAALAEATSSAHLIAGLALIVSAVIAVGSLIPAPGFSGWALVLGIVDGAGTRPDRRIRRAAILARSIGMPILVAAGVAAGLLGDPMLMLIAFYLAFVTWSGSQAATAQDDAARFMAAHGAGEVARPLVDHAQGDERIVDLMARLRTDIAVVAVEGVGGSVLGAIGPRQLATRNDTNHDHRCSDAMVPLASLRLLASASPAIDLLPEIARHGFALVREPEGLGYVEKSDLARQIRIWLALGDRGGRLGRRREGGSAKAGAEGTIVE